MIKEYIRLVDKETQEVALEKLSIALTELQSNFDNLGIYTTVTYMIDVCRGIAGVIVASTTESDWKEWARSKATSKARKFDLETIRIFQRGYGVCGDLDSCLMVELHREDVGDKKSLNRVIELFKKTLATDRDTLLKNLLTRGTLFMAEILYICGFSEIDIQSFK